MTIVGTPLLALLLLQCSGELVGAGGTLASAVNTLQQGCNFAHRSPLHQTTHPLCVAVATARKLHLFDGGTIIGEGDVNHPRTNPLRVESFVYGHIAR